MNSELVIPEGNKKTLAELVGVSVDTSSSDNNNKDSKTSNLARLKILKNATMGVKNIEGKDMNLEVIPAGAYKLDIDGTNIYCINPIVRFFAQREQWQRFDTENNRMDRSIMAEKLWNFNLKDTTGTFNLGRPKAYDLEFKKKSKDYQQQIKAIKRTKILFGTIDFNGNALDEFGIPVKGYDDPIPFILDTRNGTSIKNIETFWDQVKDFTADQMDFPKQKEVREKAIKSNKGTFANKNAENLMRNRVTLGAENFDTGFSWCAIVIKNTVVEDLIDGDIETLIAFDDWISWSNDYVDNLWKENNVEQLSDAQAELVEEFMDVE